MRKDNYPKDITSAYNYALHYLKYEPWKFEKKELPDGLNFIQQQNDDKPEKKVKEFWTFEKEEYTKYTCPVCKAKTDKKNNPSVNGVNIDISENRNKEG